MVMDWFLLYSFLDAYIEQPWKWKIMVWYGILLVLYGICMVFYWYVMVLPLNDMVSALLYLDRGVLSVSGVDIFVQVIEYICPILFATMFYRGIGPRKWKIIIFYWYGIGIPSLRKDSKLSAKSRKAGSKKT